MISNFRVITALRLTTSAPLPRQFAKNERPSCRTSCSLLPCRIVPRFDGCHRVFKRLFQNLPTDSPGHKAEQVSHKILAAAHGGESLASRPRKGVPTNELISATNSLTRRHRRHNRCCLTMANSHKTAIITGVSQKIGAGARRRVLTAWLSRGRMHTSGHLRCRGLLPEAD